MSAAPRPAESPLPRRADQLRAQLDAYRRRLAECEPDSSGFASAMSEFLDFVRTFEDREAYAACERDGTVDELREFFAPRVLEFTSRMERIAHADLLSRDDVERPSELSLLLEANAWGAFRGVGETLELADLASRRRALMVGCGPLPDSLLYLHDHTALEELVGVERDPAARRMAADLVDALGRPRIEIVDGDGTEIDYGGYDLIVCSVFAVPRREILERVADTVAGETVIVLRDPAFTGTLLFESVIDELPSQLAVRAESGPQPRGGFMLRYYVLGPREGSGAQAGPPSAGGPGR